MKITFNEIWNFIDLLNTEEKGWLFTLHAGKVSVPELSVNQLRALKNDKDYDTEILPSIFTFREILWQPDVFTEANTSLPSLRILNAHCIEIAENLKQKNSDTGRVYALLIEGIGKCSQKALIELEDGPSITNKVLGDFRICAFPIIKFFIFHPQNRSDYYKDAVNRLNYAVKIMLTQFHGRYTELDDPYWKVSFQKTENDRSRQQNPTKND
ncbi:MAG: hypothetical protein RIA62_07355 [Cyclobacteriaceae bacterium]